MNWLHFESMEENDNCLKTHASLLISGPHLPPAEITAKLGLTPTFGAAKGEWVGQGLGRRVQRVNVWYLCSKGQVLSTSLDRHLLWLLERFEPLRESLAEMGRTPDCEIDFSCYWASKTGFGGPMLSSDILARVAVLGCGITIDFADCSELGKAL